MSHASKTRSTWWLAPDVHVASVDGDLVFLSIGQHAYFCLPNAVEVVGAGAGRRDLVVPDEDLALSLLRARLLSPEAAGPAITPAPAPPQPVASAIKSDFPPPTWASFPVGARSMLDVMRGYRGKNFAEILASVQRERRVMPLATEELLEVVDDFHRWVPYAPVSGKCLLRSFMLLRVLRRADFDAHWVFGVRTWPFHAHCWLQCGDLVLDDDADRVAAFTPILVV
jgi:hypothetical protein